MAIKPGNLTIGGQIERELRDLDNIDAAETWIRTSDSPYGDDAEQASPGFNPIDTLIPAEYSTIERNENWKWYNAHKPGGYTLTPNTPGVGVDSNLVQIGNTPFWRSSNDPADPWDCERWPNSPYCGGMGLDLQTARGLLKSATGGDISISSTSCETCITYQPVFLGIPGPISRVCYRKDSEFCKVPGIEQAKAPPVYPPGQRQPRIPVPIAPPGTNRFLFCFNTWRRRVSVNALVTSSVWYVNETHQEEIHQLKLAAIAPYAGSNEGESYEVLSHGYEPGIVRVPLESFSTVGVKSNIYSTYAYDFGVPPWENIEPSGFWLDYTFLRSSSYRKLQSTDGYFRTLGNACISSQQTIYPPLSKNTHVLSGGLEVEITVKESYEDYSIVWFVDWSCSRLTGRRIADYTEIADWLSAHFEKIARPHYGFEGKQPFSFYDATQGIYASGEPASGWLKFVQVAASSECPIPLKDPAPIIGEPDPMDCCDEVLEQLDLIKLRLGTEEFPVDVPATLTNASAGQTEIANHAQFSAWFVRNLDALFGQFPIKITIADSDPTKAGEQEVEVELPNLAEGLAEVFGLAYQSEIKADLLAEMLMRLIPEVIAGKNAAIVAQSYAKANASYMGYPGNLRPTEVPSNFNLAEVKSLPEFLKESKGKLLTFHEESKDTLQDKLERLMFAAGIIKSVFMVDGKDADRLIETIEKMFDDEADNLAANKRSWEEWVLDIQKAAAPRNKDQRIVPDVEMQTPPDGPEPV